MSFHITRQIFTSVIVLSSILLGGCNKDTIKNNLSSPTSPAVSKSNANFDSYYGMPKSAAELNGNQKVTERSVVLCPLLPS